jgi:mRNA interferase RelE/StbE
VGSNRGSFEIHYADEAVHDLRSFRAFDQKKILAGIEAHLLSEPTKVSRSRIKQMVQPFWSEYRLRVDDFRVYHDVDRDSGRVNVLRILEKGREATPSRGSHETS